MGEKSMDLSYRASAPRSDFSSEFLLTDRSKTTWDTSIEDAFGIVFQLAPAPFAVLDQDFRVVAFNDAFRAATCQGADFLGKTLLEIFPYSHAQEPNHILNSLNRVLTERQTDTIPVLKCLSPRSQPPEGEIEGSYWSVVNVPLLANNGSVRFIISRPEDITDFIRDQNLSAESRPSLSQVPVGQLEAEIFKRALDLQRANRQLGQSREQLEESQRLLEITQRVGRIISWEWNFDTGKITIIGDTREVYGDKPPVSIEDFWASVHPEDRDRLHEAIVIAEQNETAYEEEVRMTWSDGSIHWVATRGKVFHEEGKQGRILGISMEISDRKLAELERDRFFDLADDLLGISGVVGGFKRLNPAWERVLGYSVEELVGHCWSEIIHSDDRANAPIGNQSLDAPVSAFEARFKHKDGTFRWLSCSIKPDPDQKLIYFSARDITDRKRAEELLRESEQNFRQLAETIPQIVFSANPDGAVDYQNQRWYAYTGLEPSESLGSAWLSVIHPEDVRALYTGWQEAAVSGRQFGAEARIKGWDGQYRWHLFRTAPFHEGDGKLVRWLGTCTDIHNQKIWQEELHRAKELADEANRAKSAFLTSMSHEIRTPLNAIMGFTELLDDPDLSDSDRQEFAATVKRNGRHLSQLIDDILDLAKVESGKLTVEFLKSHLPNILADVKAIVGPQARAKGIELRFRSDGEIPDWITTDPTKLKQILINIIGNAIKFTEAGTVDLRVSLRKAISPDEKVKLVFSVSDSGIGIDSESQVKLFQPFVQADTTTTRRYGGTGLGLILSRRLSEALGGKLELVQSAPGHGSTFEITIDPGRYEGRFSLGRGRLPHLHAREKTNPMLDGLRVLVAEDSPDNQRLIGRILQLDGANVDVAQDGVEAVNKAFDNAYDVILMDIEMPICDGLKATRDLRAKGYERPIIAFSAHAMKEQRELAMASGCDDYLTKPLNVEELLSKLTKYATTRQQGA